MSNIVSSIVSENESSPKATIRLLSEYAIEMEVAFRSMTKRAVAAEDALICERRTHAACAERETSYAARIKASQEQEPRAFAVCGETGNVLNVSTSRSAYGLDADLSELQLHVVPLYAAPVIVIPPDVAKLQRKVDRAHAAQQDAEQRELDCCHDLDAVVAENEELTRKLADQQALYRKIVILFNLESKEEFMQERGFEELTKLLAEAKSKTVPEDTARDAARYNWIRDAGATFYTDVDLPTETKHHVCEFAMDDAIDKAMLASAPQPETDRGSNDR